MASPRAPVFDIQRFSIHDGPGIRTLVFLKGCNLHCDWCQNPESQQPAPVVAFYADRCHRDAACLEVCPEDAIRMNGFRIDYERCTTCLRCVDACARGALQPIGTYMSAADVLARLLPDVPYYRSSGGGVTFSGGEPTFYPRFMGEMLALCREYDIHTVLETCGTYSQARWSPLLRQFDLIYFDLKIIDGERHRDATGFGNRRILDNARHLAEGGYPVEFRTPLVPGYTDDRANIEAIAGFLHEVRHHRLHLLPYHNLGEAKIDIINGTQPRLGLPQYQPERLEQAREWLHLYGIEPVATEEV